MTSRGLIVPEIARKYGKTDLAVRHRWIQNPEWPAPIGRRGRYKEYDEQAVEAAVKKLYTRAEPEATGSPDDLLTIGEIATYTKLSNATIYSDIKRGRWRDPDKTEDGVRMWKRETVDAIVKGRRRYTKKQPPAPDDTNPSMPGSPASS